MGYVYGLRALRPQQAETNSDATDKQKQNEPEAGTFCDVRYAGRDD